MNVSVIIVNYNTKDITRACIDSIFTQTFGIDFEVILVDNNSNDGSEIYFASDKRIVFVEAGSNLGFGRANNLGVKKSQGKYIFFLNSDTILLNNAIKEMFDWMEAHQQELNVGALGCLLSDKSHTRTHSYGKFPNAWRHLRNIWIDHIVKRFGYKSVMKLDYLTDESFDCFEVDYVTGADLFVKRSVIDKYGGFDPDFFMYCEESEMQYRWYKHGLHNYIIKTPEIVHFEGGSQKKGNFRKEIQDLRSKLIYYRKTMSMVSYFLFRLLFPLGYLHLIGSKRLNVKQKKELFKVIISL